MHPGQETRGDDPIRLPIAWPGRVRARSGSFVSSDDRSRVYVPQRAGACHPGCFSRGKNEKDGRPPVGGPQSSKNPVRLSATAPAARPGVTLTYTRLLERGGGSLRPYALALTLYLAYLFSSTEYTFFLCRVFREQQHRWKKCNKVFMIHLQRLKELRGRPRPLSSIL